MTRITVTIALLCAVMGACTLFPDPNPTKTNEDLSTLEENSFYAQNLSAPDKHYYKVKAEKLYEGKKCVIWAEEGSGVTPEQAQSIAKEYDNVIRPLIIQKFSKTNNGEADILDYANTLVGRTDKKLTVLLLDIQDGYTATNNAYVAGYFFSGNFLKKGSIGGNHYSNGRDMIYMDTYPGLSNQPAQTYLTFAHELQHLVNYVTGLRIGRQLLVDTWIDEGLSSQAEYFYAGSNPKDKCLWFSNDIGETIARGNNFFVWDNHTNKSLAILDDYASVYLFFRWLYLQTDTASQSNIFYKIETSPYADYHAVTNVAGAINSSWSNWENLLKTWLAANYYPKNDYGYTGDTYLQETIKVKPVAGSLISLYPGEGVYSIIHDSYSPVETGNHIRYAGIAKDKPAINTAPPFDDNILLTFNSNTNNKLTAPSETGSITSLSSGFPRMVTEKPAELFTGPYVMDARDILRRSGR